MSLLLMAGQRLLEATADEDVVFVVEEDCLTDEDVAVLVLNVVGSLIEEVDFVEDPLDVPLVLADDDSDKDTADDFKVLLDLAELDVPLEEGEAVEPEETMVAAC
jgi:hypothetical protein